MTQEERREVIGICRELPTGNVSDAMDNLGIRRGVITGLRALEPSQPRAAGFALTIRQIRRRKPYDGKNLARQANIIDTETHPGDMLVIDMNGMMDICTGGFLLALRAKMRGVEGEIVNGCLREADEIAGLGFPVYLRGTIPVKSGFDVETLGVNVPVMIGDVQICPGDLIVMDRTGIVSVPSERISDVLAEARKIHDHEAEMEKMIREGRSVVEARRAE